MKKVGIPDMIRRRGVAMMLVLGLGLVVMVLGMAMITTSSGLLMTSVDDKQRIRARYAAEAQVARAIAAAVERSSEYFGSALQIDNLELSELGTNPGEKGEAIIRNLIDGTKPLQTETITSGRLKGLRGLKVPLQIEATGYENGGVKAKVLADVRLYQVPIFQFGVFYEGPLEVTPGPDMTVLGRVHTNSDAYFRGAGIVTFQGPVSATGKIWQWYRGSGRLRYLLSPDTNRYLELPRSSGGSIMTSMSAMTEANQPEAVDGVRNVTFGAERLIIPIGSSTPHDLIEFQSAYDSPALKKQKFDARFTATLSSTGDSVFRFSRFVNGDRRTPLADRPFLSGPRVFWDRREDRWVKVWDFDIAKLTRFMDSTGQRDSVFYLADTTRLLDKGPTPELMLNAFRIINGAQLPRNLSIASLNPIYIQGDFNLASRTSRCRPTMEIPTDSVPDSLKYCNAQIASDAVTLLSSNWSSRGRAAVGDAGTMEQPYDSASRWTAYVSRVRVGTRYDSTFANENSSGYASSYTSGTIRVNAAILTGNKPTKPSVLPPYNYDEGNYENGYEGGWHNTIRFLENLGGATVVFKGSFVCLWAAETPGLKVSTSDRAIAGGHYSPPTRIWGFDPRFRILTNMPPGTPFLASAIFTNWIEDR